jgi:hypothetical protein
MADDQNIKLCECGCGQPAPIATRNDKQYVRGQAKRFIGGHIVRVLPKRPMRTARYCHVRIAGGPLLKHHRVRAEAALGHHLPLGAEVHHPDEDKNNPNARLVICQDRAYHLLLHARMRVKKAGGNPNMQAICTRCKQLQPLTMFNKNSARSDRRDSMCRPCGPAYRLERKAAGYIRRH